MNHVKYLLAFSGLYGANVLARARDSGLVQFKNEMVSVSLMLISCTLILGTITVPFSSNPDVRAATKSCFIVMIPCFLLI